MFCFVFFKSCINMPIFPWCCVFSTWNDLHCFLKPFFPHLLSLTTLKWTLAHGCSCNFAGFIMWNWNHNHKVMGSLPAVTDTPCKDSLYDEQDWHTDDVFLRRLSHLKTTELEVGIDWYKSPYLHELVNPRHCFIQHGQTFAQHMEDN